MPASERQIREAAVERDEPGSGKRIMLVYVCPWCGHRHGVETTSRTNEITVSPNCAWDAAWKRAESRVDARVRIRAASR